MSERASVKNRPEVLCPKHHGPMAFVAILTLNKIYDHVKWQWDEHFLQCGEPGCSCLFTNERGYVTPGHGSLHPVIEYMLCPRDQNHRCMPVVTFARGVPVRQCLDDACLIGKGVDDKPIAVGDFVLAQGHHIHRFQVLCVNNTWATIQLMGNRGEGLKPMPEFLRVPVNTLLRTALGDIDFISGTGYGCTLPDLELFVEREPDGWTASAQERMNKMLVMKTKTLFSNSDDGKQHCQVFVNSFRGKDSKLGLLTVPLEWAIYGFPLGETSLAAHN
jgi:hypothetical protein